MKMKGSCSRVDQVKQSFDESILSVSGWRKIFAQDGKEHSPTPHIREEDIPFVRLCVRTIAQIWLNNSENPIVLIGSDSRPTSSILLKICSNEFLKSGVQLLFCDILPITEIMSSCQQRDSIDGFFYISASHNPPGYNGFKFGLSEGKILDEKKMKILIESLKCCIKGISSQSLIKGSSIADQDSSGISDFENLKNVKKQTLEDYESFLCDIVESSQRLEGIFSEIKETMASDPLGIVIDFNGSSRILSCDRHYLSLFGIKTFVVGDVSGQFNHDIVPEGKSLLLCQQILEEQNRNDPCYKLGYVPDCDGDRGNLVVYDSKKDKAIPLGGQEVFCLCILSELAYLKRINEDLSKVAVVANGATSLRINHICSVFGARFFVAETGEANVVEKANELRESGFLVRCYGEGSNGGSIVHPSTGRDPLNMLTSIIKLLYLRNKEQGLAHIWCRLAKISCPDTWNLLDLLNTLPKYYTTNVFESDSLMRGIKNQTKIKSDYAEVFKYLWLSIKEKMKNILNVVDYQFISYDGCKELCDQISPGTGGLRIVFYQSCRKPVCFFWMRTSKTEPVMRVLVDVQHDDKSVYQRLYSYHCGILSYVSSVGENSVQFSNLEDLLIPLMG